VSSVYWFEVVGAEVLPRSTSAATLNDLSMVLPQGVYTTFRTYPGARVLHLDSHFVRLAESARLEGVDTQLDATVLRKAAGAAVRAAGFELSRVRITVGLAPAVTVHVSVEELHAPAQGTYRAGVACILADHSAYRDLPRSKSTRFIGPGAALRRQAPDANEALLVGPSGEILEGSSSNFFAILDGKLRTAEEGVLAGTTRAMVLSVAGGLLPIERKPVLVDDLPRLEEAFITSVGRAVLPVISIQSHVVGDGVPGPLTQEILHRFNSALEADLEPIETD
jgi:branched-chain amino acid aminotransferase